MMIRIQALMDVAKCFATVRALRWPDGVRCPGCGWMEASKDGRDETQPQRQRHQCHACRRRFDDLSGTTLASGRLPRANLRGAILRGAFLMGADLSGADLSGADLSGADLRGADLSRSRLRRARLKDAHYDRRTRWPARYDMARNGAVLVVTAQPIHPVGPMPTDPLPDAARPHEAVH